MNKPVTTRKAEKAVAAVFDAEAACFVRGAGTGAIRYALCALVTLGDTLLVHTAAVYNTTQNSLDMMGIRTVRADFNDLDNIRTVLTKHPEIKAALVQYTRQSMEDSYEMESVIQTIKSCREIPVITDDNYAVMKVEKWAASAAQTYLVFLRLSCLARKGSAVSSEKSGH